MADIKVTSRILNTQSDGADETALPENGPDDCSEMDLIELLFFAYRDFISDPDAILEQYGFGRAHHRVIHFVDRNPGMTVADLLIILRITKQSLARVLKQLVETGFIVQQPGPMDRRQRLLFTTQAGKDLAQRLTAPQSERLQNALSSLSQAISSGSGTNVDAKDLAARFLFSIINERSRPKAARLSRREDLL